CLKGSWRGYRRQRVRDLPDDGQRRGASSHSRGHQVLERQRPQQVIQPERNKTMKRILTMNPIKLASVLLLTALLSLSTAAERGAVVNDNIYNYLQLMRSDINSIKVELVNS